MSRRVQWPPPAPDGIPTEEIDTFLATGPTPEQIEAWFQANRDRIVSFVEARRVIDALGIEDEA